MLCQDRGRLTTRSKSLTRRQSPDSAQRDIGPSRLKITTHSCHDAQVRRSQCAIDQAPHQSPAPRCGCHLFRHASCVTLFSSSDSAKSSFRRVFSALSSFNGRLRYILIGYARVSKADGSQSLDLQRDAARCKVARGADDIRLGPNRNPKKTRIYW